MLGKTHMVLGTATALAVTRPGSIQDLALCLGASALGALISDIDVDTSDSHRDANVVVALAIGTVAASVAADFIFHIGILDAFTKSSSKMAIIGLFAFIIICAFGKEQPHRSFMHSFLAMVLLSACVAAIFPAALPYFMLGFLSHIAIDLFNCKRVRLLYPLPGGFCLGLFHAHGAANSVCFFLGAAGTVLGVLQAVFHILR